MPSTHHTNLQAQATAGRLETEARGEPFILKQQRARSIRRGVVLTALQEFHPRTMNPAYVRDILPVIYRKRPLCTR